MSRVDDLIKELCPNGVPFVQIGSVVQVVSGLKSIKRSAYGAGTQYPIIDQGMQQIAGYTNDASLLVEPGEYIVFGDHTRVVKFADFQFAIGADGTKILIPLDSKFITPKYLFYALQNIDIPNRGYNRHWSLVRELELPVPPLEIQREIVKILDKFTQLEAELEAELEARRKQYAYYRDQLLSFPETGGHRYKISELCDISRGRVISKEYLRKNVGRYPVYSSQTENAGVFGRIDTYDHEGEAVTWTTDGAKAGSVFYHAREAKFSITNVCGILRSKSEQLLTKFVYHSLSVSAKKYVSAGMGNPKLMANVMASIEIVVPPLEEQRRIVAILDKFDALVNDISTGLPAEIAARRKQYEYYRDKLLSFEPV